MTRRAEVATEPLLPGGGWDYADAFEIQVPWADDRPAEAWARAALEKAPPWMRAVILLAHRKVLRFRPVTSASAVLGWGVTRSEPDLVRLDADGPLLRATILARREGPHTARASTYLWFRRPVARRLWVVVGPVHRAFVPRLLRHAAERGAP